MVFVRTRVDTQSQYLHQVSHGVALATNTIAREMAKLHRQSTLAAVSLSKGVKTVIQLFMVDMTKF